MARSRSGAVDDREDQSHYNCQVQFQRMEILKDAFSNPIESLLTYEPWTENKEKEYDIE